MATKINEDDLFNDEDELETPTQEAEEDNAAEDEEGDGDKPQQKRNTHNGFNKRINELTKKRRDAEREAEAQRARVLELERKLKEVESYQSDAEVSAIEAKMDSMKQRLLAARAADDIDEEIKIQQEIAEASQRKMVHIARKSVNEGERKQLEAEPVAKTTQRRVTPEVEMLLENNPWMLAPATPEQQQAALIARRLANRLEAEGLSPFDDPEYAEQMETLLEEELTKRGLDVLQSSYQFGSTADKESEPTQRSQAASAKAGAANQRGGISSSSSVKSAKGPSFKLTAAQKELAKLAGMSEAKYAEYLTAAKQ